MLLVWSHSQSFLWEQQTSILETHQRGWFYKTVASSIALTHLYKKKSSDYEKLHKVQLCFTEKSPLQQMATLARFIIKKMIVFCCYHTRQEGALSCMVMRTVIHIPLATSCGHVSKCMLVCHMSLILTQRSCVDLWWVDNLFLLFCHWQFTIVK